MNSNAKSSVTLPRDTILLIEKLQKRYNLSSKVDVVRRSLRLLDQTSERGILREKYRAAAYGVRVPTDAEITDLDHLAAEGLDED